MAAGIGAAIAVGALATSASSLAASNQSVAKQYVIGVSNTVVGNPIRDEQLCMLKAQATASGRVSHVKVISENTSAAGQVAQIRNLLSAGVNAVLIDPSDPNALSGVIAQGKQQGVAMVSFDQAISSKDAIQTYNDQYKYGFLGMQALARQLGGKGNVVELRGAAGAPADNSRHAGVLAALKKYPNIKLVKSVFTGWQFGPAATAMLTILNSGTHIDGVWTSGVDYTVVNAFATAHKPYVPVVGADTNGFVKQAITLKSKGFIGIVVTNPLAVSAVAVDLAIQSLDGKKVPRVTEVTPQVYTSATAAGMKALKKLYEKDKPPIYGTVSQIPPYTTYSAKQLKACSAP